MIDLENELEIDPESLDVEWLNQPRKMSKVIKEVAKIEKIRDLAKDKLEFIKAELDKEIRTHPTQYEIDKITDKVVENAILLQNKYIDANKDFIEAKYEFNIAKGMVDSFEQRKTALENLVKLHGQDYFAGPRIPRNLKEENEMKQKQLNSEISSRLSLRRRTNTNNNN